MLLFIPLWDSRIIHNTRQRYWNTLERNTPVSYTHLDVYKRQILEHLCYLFKQRQLPLSYSLSGDLFQYGSKYCGEVLLWGVIVRASISWHCYCVWINDLLYESTFLISNGYLWLIEATHISDFIGSVF